MEKKDKSEGLTRRDFIKTIGLAGIASTGLNVDNGAIGSEQPEPGKAPCPGASWEKRA